MYKRNVQKLTAGLACLLGLMVSLPVAAETFRCKGKIIDEGMNQDDVLELCGPPTETGAHNVNSWTYKNDSNRLDIVIIFYANGEIERIDAVSE
jgi:hypothetical protein